MNKAWQPFTIVCTDCLDVFGINSELAFKVDMIIFDIMDELI
jgi:hypothetical protein